LREGETVEVIVLPTTPPADEPATGRSLVEFLESLPRPERLPEYWEKRDQELQAERDSWD
jgi:hypothetical protein